MYQYFVKVVPTVYNKLSGQVCGSSEYGAVSQYGICLGGEDQSVFRYQAPESCQCSGWFEWASRYLTLLEFNHVMSMLISCDRTFLHV